MSEIKIFLKLLIIIGTKIDVSLAKVKEALF